MQVLHQSVLWRYRRRPFSPSDRCPVIVSFLFLPPETQKTRKSESRFAGFVSGPICPVDFIFMPQQKEQIKNFFQNGPRKVIRLNISKFLHGRGPPVRAPARTHREYYISRISFGFYVQEPRTDRAKTGSKRAKNGRKSSKKSDRDVRKRLKRPKRQKHSYLR